MAAIFVLRVFEAGSKTRNASPMPKFVAKDPLHETTFHAKIVANRDAGTKVGPPLSGVPGCEENLL